jgi:hypothetical protein
MTDEKSPFNPVGREEGSQARLTFQEADIAIDSLPTPLPVRANGAGELAEGYANQSMTPDQSWNASSIYPV